MDIAVDQIKALRELTGAGIMECKKALQEVLGDIPRAEQVLRDKGIARAERKAGRETREGVVEAYIHSGSRIGAMVEVNCETDFVSRIPEFKDLAHHLTMQVAAMAPEYVDRSEMPEGDLRNPEEVCLLQQLFIKDPTKVVQDLVTELAARVGENVRVRRFVRFALGE